jgi:hypothetical protein
MNMAVVPVQLFQSCEGRDNALDGIARKIKIEGVLQGRVTLVRREDLNIPPREADEIRLKLGGHLPDNAAPLRDGVLRQIEDALANLWLPAVNEIGKIGDTDRVDLLAGEKNVEHRVHFTAR